MLRRALPWALVTVLLAVVIMGRPAAAAANSLTQQCESPPLSGIVDDCSGWHTAAVRLTWDWDPHTETQTSGCNTQTFLTDTPSAGTPQTCGVEWTTMSLEATTTIKVDQILARATTGAVAARPPDHDGWWTHPVAFTFEAVDQTLGVAACDTVTYGGPDGSGVQVAGGCRDAAGNTAAGAQTLSYDATPPSIGDLEVSRNAGTALIRWRASPDVVLSEVVRSADADGAPTSRLYSGSATTFDDATASATASYRYTVTGFDPAGNAASATITTAGLSGAALLPVDRARVSRAPLLRWKRKRGATYYNVQLFRGSRKILSAWPKK